MFNSISSLGHRSLSYTMPGAYPRAVFAAETSQRNPEDMDTSEARARPTACALPAELLCRVLEASGSDIGTLVAFESVSKAWHEESKKNYVSRLWAFRGVEEFGLFAMANAAKKLPTGTAKDWYAYRVDDRAWQQTYVRDFGTGKALEIFEYFGDNWQSAHRLTTMRLTSETLSDDINKYAYFQDLDLSSFDLRRGTLGERLLRVPTWPVLALTIIVRAVLISRKSAQGIRMFQAMTALSDEMFSQV